MRSCTCIFDYNVKEMEFSRVVAQLPLQEVIFNWTSNNIPALAIFGVTLWLALSLNNWVNRFMNRFGKMESDIAQLTKNQVVFEQKLNDLAEQVRKFSTDLRILTAHLFATGVLDPNTFREKKTD
jgi:hypothetical protein